MASTSTSKVATQFGESPWRRTCGLTAALALVSCVLFAMAVGAKGLPVDQAGATMMSYTALIEAPGRFDRKAVWVLGGLKLSNGTAYLGETSSGQEVSQKSVCV